VLVFSSSSASDECNEVSAVFNPALEEEEESFGDPLVPRVSTPRGQHQPHEPQWPRPRGRRAGRRLRERWRRRRANVVAHPPCYARAEERLIAELGDAVAAFCATTKEDRAADEVLLHFWRLDDGRGYVWCEVAASVLSGPLLSAFWSPSRGYFVAIFVSQSRVLQRSVRCAARVSLK